ncbi:MAG TPA: DUF2339 domain-containing protein [Casimicrobiaceae bacterium]
MAVLIGAIVGLLLGGLASGVLGAVVGLVLGVVVGAIITGSRSQARPAAGQPVAQVSIATRVNALEVRVAELERELRAIARGAPSADMDAASMFEEPPSKEPAAPAAVAPVATSATIALPLRPIEDENPALNADGTASAIPGAIPEQPASRPPEPRRAPAAPSLPPPPPNPIWAWIVGGNTLARVGVVLLFIGVGFLIKYAVEHVHVPISVRLGLVALGGVALLVVGWRLRRSHFAYAMVLQGGGVGILYLTVFGALRLYALLPPVAAFGLLVWVCAISSWLAIRQDAISLAVLSIAGGFLAPILTSTQSGNHVLLFSYYALLNAGILGIAWFKAWRVLNLLGFAFTFVIGTVWGVTRYRPEFFATTEPFLVLFFLFYVAIAVLYALRRQVEVRSYVDAGIVFGTPLVAAGLQSGLVRDIEYAMAMSALAMSALYLVLARILYTRRREDLRLLVESFLALGVLFATLAIPLAVDARWTAAAWAAEGAAIVWAGVRQMRMGVRAFGYALQLAAGIAFVIGLARWVPATAAAPYPIANSAFVGSMLVALSALFTAWIVERYRAKLPATEASAGIAAFVWGFVWWLFAGIREIDRFVAHDYRPAAIVAFLAVTAIAFATVARPLQWRAARVPPLLLIPGLLVSAVAIMATIGGRAESLLAHGGFIAWPFAIACAVALLWRHDRADDDERVIAPTIEPWHAGLFWLVLLVVAHEVAWVGRHIVEGSLVWGSVAWGLVPALAIVAVCELVRGSTWPVGAHARGYLVYGSIPVVAFLILASALASIYGSGDPAPLPYIPFLNPLDLTQILMLVAIATWFSRVAKHESGLGDAISPQAVVTVLGVLAFLWINAVAMRTIHFATGVPYTPQALWNSTLVQATLSLLWSVIALTTMAITNRRQWRVAWIVGATLLGAVVLKLFFVELAQTGTITRIVSFIGVGLLLLLIGYVAPVPPVRKESAQ